MDLMQLNYFRAVARTEKISAAAQELFLSAPALSTSISRLEKELGMPLFNRTGNRITLNAQGIIFLRHVDQLFDVLDHAKIELQQSLLHEQQHIWLMTTGSNIWLDMITRFSQDYPQITMTYANLEKNNAVDPLQQYTFLLAEKEEISENWMDALDNEVLFQDNPAILVHPSHPLAAEARVTFQMLEGETLYLPVRDTPRGDRMARLLQDNGIDPDSANSCTYVVYRSMLMQGSGVAFSTTRTRKAAQLDGLCCIPLENRANPWDMCLFWHRDRVMTECECLFKSFVEQFYGIAPT